MAPDKRKNPNAKDPFFPDRGETYTEASLTCFSCPVREQCEEYKERIKPKHGVWAGEIIKRK